MFPEFLENQHINLASVSGLLIGHLYPARELLVLISVCPGYRSRYSDSLWTGQSGNRIPVESIFYAPPPSRWAPGPTQPPIQWVLGLSRG